MSTAALRDRIIEKTMELGADDAGVCLVSDLLNGPTHQKFPLPEGIDGHNSILVLVLSHPSDQPELDYFIRKDGFRFGNSMGNRQLKDISDRIGKWLGNEGLITRDLHYYVEWGGVFLKGAAVLAGLGTIGENNLFIHPSYGPRIRLRAHLIEVPLVPSDPMDFDPCIDCQKPCLDICPEDALDVTGYNWENCQARFDRDAAESVILPAFDGKPAAQEVHYCRKCELACSFMGSIEQLQQ